MDKMTETYSLRIPDALKEMLDKLSTEQKHDLNQKLRVELARAVHASKFDARLYLGENE